MKSNDLFKNYIKKGNDDFIETDLIPFLQIPSETLNKEGIIKAKDFIISYISDFCSDIKVINGKINPLILAHAEGKTTESLLIYMMYDTQPRGKESEWISPPFIARINKLPAPLDVLGNCIIARGAYNSKTPLLCFLNIIKELKKNETLPLSLFFIFDGEEEIGSPSLSRILQKNREFFRECKNAYYPSAKQDINGNLILKLGYKGILSITIKLSSVNKEPHSAFSSIIPNPSIELVSLLSSIYNNNEFLIDCLNKPYNPSTEEQLLFNELMKTVDLKIITEKAGITFTRDNHQRKLFWDYLFKPTFNISTLKSGFLKEGMKNYVPNSAITNIDIRFAHKILENKIYEEIKEKVEKFSLNSKCDIELRKNTGYESSRVPASSILVKSLVATAKSFGIDTEIWPISPAAAPLTLIQNILGIDYITGGMGIGGLAHSTNEFIQYSSIINQRLFYHDFLQEYSRLLKIQKIESV